jgi:hypothetical protein
MALFPDIMAHVKGKLPELTKIIPQKRIMWSYFFSLAGADTGPFNYRYFIFFIYDVSNLSWPNYDAAHADALASMTKFIIITVCAFGIRYLFDWIILYWPQLKGYIWKK